MPMAEIKTRDSRKGSVRTLDKVAAGTHRVKQAYVSTKDKAENSVDVQENSAEEYAANRALSGAKKATDKGVEVTGKTVRKGTEKATNTAKKQIQKHIEKRAERTAQKATNKTVRTAQQTSRSVKQTARSAGKKTVKTAQKGVVKTAKSSVKTAERTSKAAIKTAKETAKAAQKTAKATAKAAQKAAQAARATAKAAVKAAKLAIKATIAAIKAIIAGVKALAAVIAAGGWVAVVIIIVICLIGLIVGSCFGIFASGEDSGTGVTMQSAVQEINEEYNKKIEDIKNSNTHDTVDMGGTRAEWKEVIAIYAVDKNMADVNPANPDEAQEVATMDEIKKNDLKKLFWEMNKITHKVENKTVKELVEKKQSDGTIKKVEKNVTKKNLVITVSHIDLETMMNTKHFTAEQKDMVHQLLDSENNSLWQELLHGITGSSSDIVRVAQEQLGNVGGQPYWSWYGFSSRVEWCACFVSWCANECGYIKSGLIPKYSLCDTGVEWFKSNNQWLDNTETPQPGMIIFFDWAYDGIDGNSDHTGVVEKVENGQVYTIEGNSGDACKEHYYPIGHREIMGYGCPAY